MTRGMRSGGVGRLGIVIGGAALAGFGVVFEGRVAFGIVVLQAVRERSAGALHHDTP